VLVHGRAGGVGALTQLPNRVLVGERLKNAPSPAVPDPPAQIVAPNATASSLGVRDEIGACDAVHGKGPKPGRHH
jgi:hypothetical protein